MPAPEPARVLTLSSLPDELLLLILTHLPLYDLLQLSRTSHRLRRLAHDAHLHALRRRHAIHSLLASPHLPLTALHRLLLSPPHAHIYLSRTHELSRRLSRSLARIKLGNFLTKRPSRVALIEANILPEGAGVVAPALVARRRSVLKESLKDAVRAWVENRGVAAQRRRMEMEVDEVRTVKELARKLSVSVKAEGRVRSRMRSEEMPTRARVWGLRRFWEGVTREALAS